MPPAKEIRTPINVSLPPALHSRLVAFCEERIATPSWVVERALMRLFEDLAAQEGTAK